MQTETSLSTEEQLFIAVEALSENVVLFDADDRVVLANKAWRELNKEVAEFTKPGTRFEDHLRALVENGLAPEALGREEEWLRERMERHLNPSGPFEVARQDGRWIRVHEQRLPNNGIILIISDITESKQAEQALRESDQRFRAVVNNSPAKVHIKDAQGRYILINSLAEELFGVSEAEALGKTSHEIFPEEQAAAFAAHDREVLEGRKTVEREEQWLREDGVHTYLTVKFPILDSGGEVTGIGAIGTDITERKRAEDARRASQQLLRAVVDAVPAMINAKDRESRYILMNQRQAELYGVAPEQAVGKTATELLGSEYGTQTETLDKQVFETGQVLANYEEDWRGPSGKSHSLLTTKAPLRNSKGEVTNVVTTALDISDRKRAEEALRASEAGLANAQRIAQLGNWDWNITTNELFWSDEIYRIFGLEPGQIAATYENFLGCVHADDREFVEEAVRKALEERQPYSVDLRIVRPDGRERIVHEEGEVVFDDAGKPVRMTGTDQDITERMAIERQLRQAQKMEAVGQLTSGVAHDFNNLLAVTLGYAERLRIRLGSDNPDAQAIIRASKRGAELTQRLLAFSRKQTLAPVPLDLNASMIGMTDLLRRTLGETIEIETAATRGLWSCEADPGQLENALLNLAVNARDAMPGGGKLTIEVSNQRLEADAATEHDDVAPGDYVVLGVSDTGVGMAPEVLEHVFEPFFTTKQVGEGTGLGLSMIYGFAKQSGGFVTIDSQEDQGTTVKLYLPRTEGEAEREAKEAEVDEPKARGETVLLVEDDPDVRELVATTLATFGYRVLEAQDGKTALSVLAETAPVDLLISDVVLPGGMSGPDIAKEAARLRPDLRTLFISGYPGRAVESARPFDREVKLLKKPFQKHELAQEIRAVLDAEPRQSQ